ncbi:alpha/beta hydrolase [Acinetobacter shaoyimingii]|uniref:Alpha/beta hydrolase n=2 Tax=Acinetobacter shaoyimingii TaxID=2715164 RepID=A0A6G8S086_9GAMM|nr:alpha/beta hydrolase [Acinetobacter shaoyimingii]NHB58565.1 alpha/beta hydrolase [Acinetobacter shaoyimingii]QIO07458.1 alpha/beta hydrolase [Acinetobacter shaoyimingii]
MSPIQKHTLIALFTLTPLLFSGCQVVSVKNQSLNVTIANERDSILTRKKMSEASLNVLSMTGRQAEKCTETPDECVHDLKIIPQIQDEQLLATASEIYLTNALSLDSSSSCNISVVNKYQSKEKQDSHQKAYEQCLDQELAMLDKSIRYSYAYLFKTKRHPTERLFDNRQVQIRDFYNQALAKMITIYTARYKGEQVPKQIKIGKSIYAINYNNYPQLADKKLDRLESSYNLNFSGLRSINRRDGFGSEFVATLPADKTTKDSKYIVDPLNYKYENGINPNIHQPRYLSVTMTAQPQNASSVDDILNSPNFQLNIYDPYSIEKLNIGGNQYPLAANFSAPYGLWLAENNLGAAAYLSLIDRDKSITMPHLYMLEPYNPNKKIIVLVHGLASSPEAWIRLTNDIMGDTALRENYQVWQVFYSTNMPILESRFQIDAIVQQAFATLDQNSPSAKDAVLIGHSMGGIIARLMVSDADLTQPALKLMKPQQLYRFKNEPLFKARLMIKPISNFDRAIFLSSPHRGTDYADRWFTLAARKIIKVPGAFLGALADSITDNDVNIKSFMKDLGHGLIQNGPSDLSHNSKFTELTENVMPAKGIVYHSILGNLSKNNDPSQINDGVVPYKSAHLDGAASEIIIKGGHSIQETPEAVLELRRILRLHLKELGIKIN